MAIAEEIFADNDADIIIDDLPAGLTVEWGMVPLGSGGAPPEPDVALDVIHADVSGTCAGETDPVVQYTAVLEGSAITARLLTAYRDAQLALVVKVGQDLRVYGVTTVRAAKLVT